MNPLTTRETEILRLILNEYTSKEIGEHLKISMRTVETHRKNILKKTGAKNLVALVKYGLRQNLLPQGF